jgi:hypothetical protein
MHTRNHRDVCPAMRINIQYLLLFQFKNKNFPFFYLLPLMMETLIEGVVFFMVAGLILVEILMKPTIAPGILVSIPNFCLK